MEPIPEKNRKEWQMLLNGELDVKLENYVLQMKVEQMKRMIKAGKTSIEDAVDAIHSLCEKYAIAVRKDMEKIFN